MNDGQEPAVWFLTVQTGTGTDVSTRRLVEGLRERGIRAEITWLPLRSEYVPWTVPVPKPPAWATVVHVNTWLSSRFIPTGLPVLATIRHSMHDPALRQYKPLSRRLYHSWWIAPNERRVLARADRVVAVSQFAAKIARRALLDIPIEVIYNGVDTHKFRPGTQRRKPGGRFRLLYVGNWKKLKGVDLLSPIMRELGDGFELRYTGGRAAEQEKLGRPGNMRDIGRLKGEEAVVTAMQDADALLFPSRTEGHPLAVIEAMACGLPVIATRGSSLVEVVEDGSTGILCPQDDVGAFVAACRSLRDSPSFWIALSNGARTRAASNYSIEAMIDAYIAAYRGMDIGLANHGSYRPRMETFDE